MNQKDSSDKNTTTQPHLAETAAKGVLSFFVGKLAMFPLALGFLLVAVIWNLVSFQWQHQGELKAASQRVNAPITAHYWRVVDPPKELQVQRMAESFFDWYSFEATLEAAVPTALGVQQLRWRDPEGERMETYPPKSRFDRSFALQAGIEYRLTPAQVERLRALPAYSRFGETARPDWRKTEWDGLQFHIDDPLMQTALSWTYPENYPIGVYLDPNEVVNAVPEVLRGPDRQLINWVLLLFSVVVFGAFALILLLQGTMLLSVGGGHKTNARLVILFVLAVPLWSPYLGKVIAWLSPTTHELIEKFALATTSRGFFQATQTERAVHDSDEIIVRYDPNTSHYRDALPHFVLRRPNFCCNDANQALDEILKQTNTQFIRLTETQQDQLLRQLIEWQKAGHGHLGVAYLRSIDALSRDANTPTELRELAGVTASWITRFPRSGWGVFQARLESEFARLRDHPDANIAENARQASGSASPAP